MTQTSETRLPSRPHPRGLWHDLGKLLAATVLAAMALTWMWSTVAAEAFHAPALRFSDAAAFVLVVLVLAYGCGVAFRLGQGGAK